MSQPKPSCPGCATFYSEEQWRALTLVRSMNARDLVPLVTTSWSGRVIEVRECSRCGRSIARFVPPRAAAFWSESLRALKTRLESS
jgi:hypothetical protein